MRRGGGGCNHIYPAAPSSALICTHHPRKRSPCFPCLITRRGRNGRQSRAPSHSLSVRASCQTSVSTLHLLSPANTLPLRGARVRPWNPGTHFHHLFTPSFLLLLLFFFLFLGLLFPSLCYFLTRFFAPYNTYLGRSDFASYGSKAHDKMESTDDEPKRSAPSRFDSVIESAGKQTPLSRLLRRGDGKKRLGSQDMSPQTRFANMEVGEADSGSPTEYRTYKRRWFGLVQLVLMNIIVSWDVSNSAHSSRDARLLTATVAHLCSRC